MRAITYKTRRQKNDRIVFCSLFWKITISLILPHDHRQLGAGLQAAVRDLARLQDGRPLDLLHLAHADQHEQAEVIEDQVKIMCNNNQKNVSYLLLFSMMVYFLE